VERGKIDFRLYLITDRNIVAPGSSLVTAVRKALKGGVRAVQLREKDMDTRSLLRMAYKMREVTDVYSAKLLINDRADIALAVGADGVHLTRESIPAEALRQVVRKGFFIGVSTHSVKEAKEAERAGADFITFGPVYRTRSKLKYGEPMGTEMLRTVCRETDIPVFALGGVKEKNIDEVRKAGAHGVSMISGILGAHDIGRKTEAVMKRLGERNGRRQAADKD
jgi:thiamine-phosphate pyrophosphorylase